MSGASTSRVSAVQMFDVVPYIILQNALKYSPDYYEISISVTEDAEHIHASVSSYGPALEPEELSKIFNPGFRGDLAQRFESQGSGMGLFVVKRLIDFCSGAEIEFRQGDSDLILQGIRFRTTTVNLTLSKAKS